MSKLEIICSIWFEITAGDDSVVLYQNREYSIENETITFYYRIATHGKTLPEIKTITVNFPTVLLNAVPCQYDDAIKVTAYAGTTRVGQLTISDYSSSDPCITWLKMSQNKTYFGYTYSILRDVAKLYGVTKISDYCLYNCPKSYGVDKACRYYGIRIMKTMYKVRTIYTRDWHPIRGCTTRGNEFTVKWFTWDENNEIGHITYLSPAGKDRVITDFWVEPRFRRRGYGHAMMNLNSLRYNECSILIPVRNKLLLQLARQHGFTIDSIVDDGNCKKYYLTYGKVKKRAD